jgi:hypothetical protein
VNETNAGHGHRNSSAPHEKMQPAQGETMELAAATPASWDGICLSVQEPEPPINPINNE